VSRAAASSGNRGIASFLGFFPVYGALAAAGFRRYATYRQATVAGAVTNAIFGFLRCYALLAAAAGAGGIAAGYDAPRLATFVWVSQGMLATVNLWGPWELADRIRTGEVVADLLRPVNPVWQEFSLDLGRAGYAVLVRFTAQVVVGALAFDLYAPRRFATYPLFALSLLLAVVVCFGCRYLVYASAYWLLDIRGPHLLWLLMSSVPSGLFFPLWFLPAAVTTTLLYATPFPSLFQVPLDILNERTGSAGLVFVQLGWALVVLALALVVQRRGARKLVVQGG
jgi:ABC-2 type transport system permease protein